MNEVAYRCIHCNKEMTSFNCDCQRQVEIWDVEERRRIKQRKVEIQ